MFNPALSRFIDRWAPDFRRSESSRAAERERLAQRRRDLIRERARRTRNHARVSELDAELLRLTNRLLGLRA